MGWVQDGQANGAGVGAGGKVRWGKDDPRAGGRVGTRENGEGDRRYRGWDRV